jgi:hypothetical protein
MEAEKLGMGPECNLDVEIMGTSLVVIPLGLPPPMNEARVFWNLDGIDASSIRYAPVVIVPPVLDFQNPPEELAARAQAEKVPLRAEDPWTEDTVFLAADYSWRRVFDALCEVLDQSHKERHRVGFHCDAMASQLPYSQEEAYLAAFDTAFSEFLNQTTRIGIRLLT